MTNSMPKKQEATFNPNSALLHARKCSKPFGECRFCDLTREQVKQLPPHVASKFLSGVVVPTLRTKLADVSMSAYIDRTNDKSKRAGEDCAANFDIFAAYESMKRP